MGFIFLGQNTPIAWLVIFFIIRQIGVGVLMMPIFTWGMSKISKSHYADGTAMLSSLRTAAGALGAAGFVSANDLLRLVCACQVICSWACKLLSP